MYTDTNQAIPFVELSRPLLRIYWSCAVGISANFFNINSHICIATPYHM